MILLLVTAVIIAAVTFAANRSTWLKSRPVMQGILFGILSIVAEILSTPAFGNSIAADLRNAPPIIAGFFFSPLAGIIAGAIGALERAFSPLWDPQSILIISPAVGTLAAGCYAAGLKKWIFEDERPALVPALIAGTFGEILHLALIFLLGMNNLPLMVEVYSSTAGPASIGIAVSIALSAIACNSWKGWRRNFLSVNTLSFIAFGLAFGVICTVSSINAKIQTDNNLQIGVRELEKRVEDQISYMLHCNAVSLADYLGTSRKYTIEEMEEYANLLDVDEINIFGREGQLLATNRREVQEHNQAIQTAGPLEPFFNLIGKKQEFVKQPFRENRSNPGHLVKYIGVPMPDGDAFLELGYTWERLEKEFKTFFFPVFSNSEIGETGCVIVVDEKGRIMLPVFRHSEGQGALITAIGMPETWNDIKYDKLFDAKLFGEWHRCVRYESVGKWGLFAAIPMAEYYGPAVITIIVSGFILFSFCITFRLIMYHLRKVRKKIDDMRAADMMLASTIQSSELRTDKPTTNGLYQIEASMEPAKEVGGDFYDYYKIADGKKRVITIADVSGKGVPAAFFMMKAKNALETFVQSNLPLDEAVTKVNQTLNRSNDAFMFVTAWIGIYSPDTGILEYVSAGHNPPLIHRADGSVEWLNSQFRQKPLAASKKSVYHTESIQLNAGDTLFLYTDGVTEAMNKTGELYGDDRLTAILQKVKGDLISSVNTDLEQFIEGAPQADDKTMLTLEVIKNELDC